MSSVCSGAVVTTTAPPVIVPQITNIVIIIVVPVSVVVFLIVTLIVITVGMERKLVSPVVRPRSAEGLSKVGQSRQSAIRLLETADSFPPLVYRYPAPRPPVMRWYAARMPLATVADGYANPYREQLLVVNRTPVGQLNNHRPYLATPTGCFYGQGWLNGSGFT
jgi:hypothetical protein